MGADNIRHARHGVSVIAHGRAAEGCDNQPFPLQGNVTLKQALSFACLARPTAYKYGIVPEYNDHGKLIDTGKTPPFPWSHMPHSLIRNRKGKKLFDAAEIRAWLEAVRYRSRQIDDVTLNNLSAPVKRGDIQHG